MKSAAESVAKNYQDQGYKILKQWTKARYIYLIIAKDGQKYFLKIGENANEFFKKTPLEEKWLNEDRFRTFIEECLNKSSIKPPFRLAKIIESGANQLSSWRLYEFLGGPHLAEEKFQGEINQLEPWLPSIVETIRWFDNLSIKRFPRPDKSPHDKAIEDMRNLSKESVDIGVLPQSELARLIRIVKDSTKVNSPRVQQSDFTPWHMHDDGFPNFVLIDLEHAKLRPRYYDLAYLYYRSFIAMGYPNLAKKIIRLYLEKVEDRETFFRDFRPALAERASGCFRLYLRSDKNPSREKYFSLAQNFLALTHSSDLKGLL